MAGSIHQYETKKGLRYRVRYRKPDGATTDKRGFTTKRDARLFISTVQVAKAKGQYLDHTQGSRLVSEFAETWKNGHLLTLKPSSQNVMETSWRIHGHPQWGNRQIASIRPSEISAWIGLLSKGSPTKKPLAAQTVRRAVFTLSLILDLAVQDGIITANPVRGIKLPAKQRKPIVYLTHQQVEQLATKSREPDLIRFLAYTGLRWGEMAALQKKHLDLPKGRMRIESNVVYVRGRNVFGTPKSGEPRTVAIPQFLTFTLKRLTKDRPAAAFVFGTNNTPLPRPHSVYSWFASAVKQMMTLDTEFPRITPHDLRHTAASLAVSAGANVKAVQRMLGHASAGMTLDVYANLFEDDLDAVAVSLGAARTLALSESEKHVS